MAELKLTVIAKVVEGNPRPVIMAALGDNFPDPSPDARFLTPDEAIDLVTEHAGIGRLAERIRELEEVVATLEGLNEVARQRIVIQGRERAELENRMREQVRELEAENRALVTAIGNISSAAVDSAVRGMKEES